MFSILIFEKSTSRPSLNELEMSKMDNHIDRPEISNAIKDGISKIYKDKLFYIEVFLG